MSFADAVNKAAEQTDMNEAQAGGGFERTLPAEGVVQLRLISYIETGVHEDEWKGQKKKKNKVTLQFELSGPKHPPIELEDGRKIPQIISVSENIYLNEKANFYKLFKRMNHTGEFKHMAQMLGQPFLGTVVHVTRGEGDNKRTYANLRDDNGYTIRPPFFEDPISGDVTKLDVAPALTPQKCFLWDYPTKEMWDSIFIDGQWDAKKDDKGNEVQPAKSKNFYQNAIKSATNFSGSPIYDLLAGNGEFDAGEAESVERSDEDKQAVDDAKAGAGDPLEGIG